MSPWAAKRLHEFGGDITKFRVVKVWPSILEQVVLRIVFQLADIHFTHQRRNILVVFIARFGFGDEFGGDITKFRVVKVWPSILEQVAIAKTEPGDENNHIAAKLMQAFGRPWRHNSAEIAGRDAILFLKDLRILGDITKFRVVKVWPSILEQVAIAKTEPGDENNQDITHAGVWPPMAT
jgi:predicted Ser/Thr protein kinase